MRIGPTMIALLGLGGVAAADDGLRVGAAVGAGGQGSATYGALELQLDALWRGVRLGLGARGLSKIQAGDDVTVLTGMPNHPTGVLAPEYRGAIRCDGAGTVFCCACPCSGA